MSRLTQSLASLLIISLLSGCATHIPVQRENASLNINYTATVRGAPTGKVVAIVSPEFVRDNDVASMKQAGQPGVMPNP
jgi:hypothetical protein